MTKPIITVVVPLYNEEKFINRCITSLANQTYEELELILVDGGSTDGSAALCDRWSSDWSKVRHSALGEQGKRAGGLNAIKIIHTQNRGVSASRNIGIDAAEGEYITFVDGDDWLESEAIERMYEVLSDGDCDMAGVSFASRYDTPSDDEDIKSGINKMMAAHFLSNNLLNGDVRCWGRLYKKELIAEQRFKEGLTIGEDMLFLLEYLKKCRQIAVLEYEGYNYYRNPAGAMERPFTAAAMDQIVCWEEAGKLLGITDKLRANILIAVMLTASRIAVLDNKEWGKYSAQIAQLASKLKEYKQPGAMRLLDRGYKLKIWLFGISPMLYIKLYHRHKFRK